MEANLPAFCRAAAFRAFTDQLPYIGSAEGLFGAAWAIAQHEHPEAKLAEGEAVVAQLVTTIRGRVRSESVEAKLAHLHDLLFDLLGYQGNVDDYYAPANSYLCEVLRTKRGLPITLTMLYRRVAAGIGLTVHGVNAPGHFLAEVVIDHDRGESIYVDPFFGGGLLHASEVYERIHEATGRDLEPSVDHLSRATPQQWLGRMLNNLQAVFAAAGRERDVYAMQELQALL